MDVREHRRMRETVIMGMGKLLPLATKGRTQQDE
jgi:hypothetical protein